MSTNNLKSNIMRTVVLTGFLMGGGNLVAGESDWMVSGSEQVFGLQEKVQSLLGVQIDQATTGMLSSRLQAQMPEHTRVVVEDVREQDHPSAQLPVFYPRTLVQLANGTPF